jgi:hypothetical protein
VRRGQPPSEQKTYIQRQPLAHHEDRVRLERNATDRAELDARCITDRNECSLVVRIDTV